MFYLSLAFILARTCLCMEVNVFSLVVHFWFPVLKLNSWAEQRKSEYGIIIIVVVIVGVIVVVVVGSIIHLNSPDVSSYTLHASRSSLVLMII